MYIRLLAVCLLLSFSVAAQSPRGILETDRVAKPILIVEPKFPDQVSHENFPIEIKLRGTVTEKGQMTSFSFPSSDGREKFVAVIRDVLPTWRFMPALNHVICTTTDSEMTASVWFDMPNGKPSISVSMPRGTPDHPGPSTEARGRTDKWIPRRWKKTPQISFPRVAIRLDMEGAAAVIVKVNWAGDIVDPILWYYTPHESFGDAALEGVRGASFEPRADDEEKSRLDCVVVPTEFCFGDSGARFPNSGCQRNRS